MKRLDWWKAAWAVCVLCTAAIASPAQTFTTLHSFDNTDGANPLARLVQATDGNFYGTTPGGGANGYGTVFKITQRGTLTTLHNFCPSPFACLDGAEPYGGLVQGTDGNFYGTTLTGGANGQGTIFRIALSGIVTTLYAFCSKGNCADGSEALAALVQATDGNLYGTTFSGGVYSRGTVFKITPTGKLTTLHSFCSQSGCPDGSEPSSALVQATNGSLYATTLAAANGTGGTVFEITPGGTLTTLYSFCQSSCTDGNGPAALVQATNGSFYGTTQLAGANGYGTIFEITAGGTLTTLYSFCAETNCTDGTKPYAGLLQATNGNFYGTTTEGANDNCAPEMGCGTVFEITPGGTLTTLYKFCPQSGCTDGSRPVAGLIQDTDGSFYGTTELGGANISCNSGCGTAFGLSVGLGPFVETLPTSGKVGAVVKILGTNLTGASSVTFNGTAAVFKGVSSSLITTTVPGGATSGKVHVTTPGGTVSSNVPFRVLP